MIRIQTRSFRLPGWVVPVMVLLALALLPFAILLAVVLGTAALAVALLGSFLRGPSGPVMAERPRGGLGESKLGSKVIDVDYEVKNGHQED